MEDRLFRKSPLGFVALSFASPFSVCLMIRVEKRRGGGGRHDVRGVGSWVIHIFVAIICMAGRERRGVGMCMIGRE